MGQATEKQRKFVEAIAGGLGIDLPDQDSFESFRDFIAAHKKEYYQRVNDQQRMDIIEQVSIVDVAKELGFTVVRKGKYYSLKEHDSVIIDTEKKCFWRNSEPGGGKSIGRGDSVIGFAEMFSGKSRQEIMEDFSQRVRQNAVPGARHNAGYTREEKQEDSILLSEDPSQLPEEADNMRRVFAYLTKSRMIDPDIVKEMVHRKLLYQSKKNENGVFDGNCVFVSRDENGVPVSACMRGTNTERRFVGDVPGCDYAKGFIINNHADELIVTESYIDALSIMSILKAQGIDHRAYDYMPLAGATKFDAVVNYLQDNRKDILCAFDADKGGRKNLEALKQSLQEKGLDVVMTEHFPPKYKDWNEELQEGFRRMSVNQIDFFQGTRSGKVLSAEEQIQETIREKNAERCKELAKKLFPELPELSQGLTDKDFEMVIEKVSTEQGLSDKERVEKLCGYEKLWKGFEEFSKNNYDADNEDAAMERALKSRSKMFMKSASKRKGLEF